METASLQETHSLSISHPVVCMLRISGSHVPHTQHRRCLIVWDNHLSVNTTLNDATALTGFHSGTMELPLGPKETETLFRRKHNLLLIPFSSVRVLSRVWLFVTPWTVVCQASLSITNSWSLLKLMSIESVMPSNHPILCHPLLLLPSFIPQHQGLFKWVSSSHQVAKVLEFQPQHQSIQWIFRTDLLYDGVVGSPCSPRDSQDSSPTPQFKTINSSVLSFLYSPTLTSIHDYWKTHSFD